MPLKVGDCVVVQSEKYFQLNGLKGVILPRTEMKGHILAVRPEPWHFIQFTKGSYMVWEESELQLIKDPKECSEIRRLQAIYKGAHYLGIDKTKAAS